MICDSSYIGDKDVVLCDVVGASLGVARAVYAYYKPVILLDDPYSALDASTAMHLCGFLQEIVCTKHHRSVVVVTHSVQLLRQAQCILVMEEGVVRCRGNDVRMKRDA